MGNISVTPVSIYCLYKASSKVKTQWWYNGNKITEIKRYRTFDDYKVNFEGNITSAIEGTYTLQVIDGTDSITMNIVVTVLGPPILVNPECLPELMHAWEHENAVFSCNYRNNPRGMVIIVDFPS